jgi:hypothetical protein
MGGIIAVMWTLPRRCEDIKRNDAGGRAAGRADGGTRIRPDC